MVLANHLLFSFDDAKLVGLVCMTTNKIDKESCFPRRSEVFCHINRGGRKLEQSGGLGSEVIILYEYPHNDLLTEKLPATDRPCPVSRKTSEVGG